MSGEAGKQEKGKAAASEKEKAPRTSSSKTASTKGSGEASKADKAPAQASAAPVAKDAPAGGGAPTAGATSTKSSSGAGRERAAPGQLSDDTLTQVAQAKFDAQEEQLRHVVRNSASLIRDFPKLSEVDCDKKIADIRKCLFKYELQYIRVSELQEKRRRIEIENLETEAKRCHEEAEAEVATIADLGEVLEREKRRRKRYEGYEEAAAEVNKKKTRSETQAGIDAATEEIAQLKQKREELEGMIEERNKRAQLLRGAVAELANDLRREQQATAEAVKACGGGAGTATSSAAGENCATGTAALVEVIS